MVCIVENIFLLNTVHLHCNVMNAAAAKLFVWRLNVTQTVLLSIIDIGWSKRKIC